MKAKNVSTVKWLTMVGCVFAPFLVVGFAVIAIPNAQVLRNFGGIDWIWLILLGAMMAGLYYFLAVYLLDEEEISEEFQSLDHDHDGFISREDTANWPDLSRSFDKFDSDHDGRLSRIDFAAFENAVPAA
jgi:hypothetical protein